MNTLTLKFVSDDFATTSEGITGADSGTTATVGSTFTPTGDAVETGAISNAFVSTTPTYTTAQRKVRVSHSNHAMHDSDNNVTISNVKSEIAPTTLTASISATDTTLNVNDATAFHKTINGSGIGSAVWLHLC